MYIPAPLPMDYPPPFPKYAFETPRPKDNFEIQLPKTFITRKGALLLFSEDFANKSSLPPQAKKKRKNTQQTSASLDDLDLRTVDDFARSILTYGSRVRNSQRHNHMQYYCINIFGLYQ